MKHNLYTENINQISLKPANPCVRKNIALHEMRSTHVHRRCLFVTLVYIICSYVIFFLSVFLQQEKQFLTLTNSLQIHSVNDADVNSRGTPTLDQLVARIISCRIKNPMEDRLKKVVLSKKSCFPRHSLCGLSLSRVRRDFRASVLSCSSVWRSESHRSPHPGNWDARIW